MSQENEFVKMVSEHLEQVIEPFLESINVPLNKLPLQAAIMFVDSAVIKVGHVNGIEEEPGNIVDFVGTEWFRYVFSAVEQWYKARLGSALDARHPTISGVVIIYGAPFRVEIPTTVKRAGKPGDGEYLESIRIRIPDVVLEDEDVLSWIVDPPNLEVMADNSRRILTDNITEVANGLRSIRTKLMGTGGQGQLLGLQRGTIAHFEAFASLIVSQDNARIQKAYWELQMACESSFKAVTLQRTGKFRETHDLFTLYDDISAVCALSISRDTLKRLPKWNEAVDLRYSIGERNKISDCYNCYLLALKVARSVVTEASTGGLENLGRVEIELGRPPWFGG